MEPYNIAKQQYFEQDTQILTELAQNNINILRVTPHPVCDESPLASVTVDFEYLYRLPSGQTKWHKGSVTWHDQRQALQYVLDVGIELQKRLGQSEEF